MCCTLLCHHAQIGGSDSMVPPCSTFANRESAKSPSSCGGGRTCHHFRKRQRMTASWHSGDFCQRSWRTWVMLLLDAWNPQRNAAYQTYQTCRASLAGSKHINRWSCRFDMGLHLPSVEHLQYPWRILTVLLKKWCSMDPINIRQSCSHFPTSTSRIRQGIGKS